MQKSIEKIRRCGAVLLLASLGAAAAPSISVANGFGESTAFQFRSASDRVALNQQEQTRLQFKIFERDSAGASQGIGQTGNQVSISVTGSGNNTIDVGQDNTGDQSIQDVTGNGNNTTGVPPQAAVSSAADALMALP